MNPLLCGIFLIVCLVLAVLLMLKYCEGNSSKPAGWTGAFSLTFSDGHSHWFNLEFSRKDEQLEEIVLDQTTITGIVIERVDRGNIPMVQVVFQDATVSYSKKPTGRPNSVLLCLHSPVAVTSATEELVINFSTQTAGKRIRLALKPLSIWIAKNT